MYAIEGCRIAHEVEACLRLGLEAELGEVSMASPFSPFAQHIALIISEALPLE